MGFVFLFGLMANVAWATALNTTGPWFDAAVSLQVYVLALAVGSALLVLLAVVGSLRAAALDERMAQVERRIAALRRSLPGAKGSPAAPEEDIEVELDSLGEGVLRAAFASEKEGHDSLIEVSPMVRVAPAPSRAALLRDLVRERNLLRALRGRIVMVLAGPAGVCLVFLIAAGAMLPGTGSFAASHFQLNTTLVLLLSYGVAPLVSWSAIAIALLLASRASA